MTAESRVSPRPDYGLDAPPVVRNLIVADVVGLGLWSSVAARLWSGVIRIPLGGTTVAIGVAPPALSIGVVCAAMALWMVWTGRVGKVRERERLLNTLTWSGDERVLDVGCGRGLMLLGAAKRLRDGRAVGVDLWRTEDLAGNTASALWANAAAEGVADRVSVETADMRALPFPDASFDVVVSRAAVHNLPVASDRRRAIDEVARVLRPGGRVLISDIRHLADYAGALREHGFEARVEGSPVSRVLLGAITFGALRPGVLRAQRPAFVRRVLHG